MSDKLLVNNIKTDGILPQEQIIELEYESFFELFAEHVLNVLEQQLWQLE